MIVVMIFIMIISLVPSLSTPQIFVAYSMNNQEESLDVNVTMMRTVTSQLNLAGQPGPGGCRSYDRIYTLVWGSLALAPINRQRSSCGDYGLGLDGLC